MLVVDKIRKIFKLLFFSGVALLLAGCNVAVLNSKGLVAAEQRNILVTAVLLMLIIIVPVIILTVVFAIKYRASNTKASYAPTWAHSTLLEFIWWAIPCIIIVILAIITWVSSHELDPYRPLDNPEKPLKIQVVALDWRWLFIYPEQNIATVNFVEFPANKPIRFYISADAPMNSFQIPQLAGQIYAMAGMRTKLNMIADKPGDYDGYATQYNGNGFVKMRFIAKATESTDDFNRWVNKVKKSPNILNVNAYNQLSKPNDSTDTLYYSAVTDNLFKSIIMKYTNPNYVNNAHELVIPSKQKIQG